MRSEKEIQERIKTGLFKELKTFIRNGKKVNTKGEEYQSWLVFCNSTANVALKWTLEGEPRYSVAELEKIYEFFDNWTVNNPEFSANDFVDLLHDQKKIKEILK